VQIPRIVRRINRAFTNPAISLFAGFVPPFAIVHHTGRSSGQRYRTPVIAFETPKGYVTPMPDGTDTDWCLNVLDAGHCALEVGGRRVEVRNPRIVDAAEAAPMLPALLRSARGLANLPGYLLVDRKGRGVRRR